MSDHLTELLALPADEKMVIASALALDMGYKLEPMTGDNLPVAATKAGVTAKMVDDAVDLWNRMAAATAQGNPAHTLPKVRKLNPANRKLLALRLAEFGAEGWRTCVETVYRSAHCRGINDRGWKADISYLLQAKGSNKCANGGYPADYQEKSNGGQRTGPARRGDERSDGLRGFDRAIRGGLAEGGQREGGGPQGGGQAGPAERGAPAAQHRLAFGRPGHG